MSLSVLRPVTLLMAPVVSAHLAVVLLAPPASAHRKETTDPAGDVLQTGEIEPGQDDTANLLPAPDNTTVDITRTVVKYGMRRLKVRIDLRELGGATTYYSGVIQVRTPAAIYKVEASHIDKRPYAVFSRLGEPLECRGVSADADRDPARVVFTVPASCFHAPRWVRIGAGVFRNEMVTGPDGTERMVGFGDDAHRVQEAGDYNLAKGSRVWRG